MRTYPLLALALLALAASPAPAQPVPRSNDPARPSRYVTFPIAPGDLEALVRAQLKQADELEKLRALADAMLRDPKKFNLDPKTLKGLNVDNPAIQDQLKGWIDTHPPGTEPSPQELQRLGQEVQKILDAPLPPPTSMEAFPPAPTTPPPAPPDPEEPFRDLLTNAMERAEASKLGDVLRDSPAWRTAFTDLRASLGRPDLGHGHWNLEQLGRELFKLDRLPKLDAKMLERLGDVKAPKLPNWTAGLPRSGMPAVTRPPLPTASALGTLAAWLLFLGLVAVLAWQASRWLKLTGPRGRAAAAGLGPWPVDPRQIATRAELVQAFDYLALLVLGTPARAWHHRAVARALAGRAESLAGSADRLAALYEQARYTEGAEALPEDARDDARRALGELAGVAPA